MFSADPREEKSVIYFLKGAWIVCLNIAAPCNLDRQFLFASSDWVFMSVAGGGSCISTTPNHRSAVAHITHITHSVAEPGSLDGGTDANVNGAERFEGPELKVGKIYRWGKITLASGTAPSCHPGLASLPAPPLCRDAKTFHASWDEIMLWDWK